VQRQRGLAPKAPDPIGKTAARRSAWAGGSDGIVAKPTDWGGTLSIVYVFTIGVWLAVVQVALFCSLEMLLSSALVTYLTIVCAWLVGAGLGVWIPRGRWSAVLMWLTGASPYLVYGLLAWHPFETSLIWVHGVLIGMIALFAGQFFQQERTTFQHVGALFFWENTGFTVGLILGVVGIMLGGRTFITVAPGVGCVVAVLLGMGRGRIARRSLNSVSLAAS